MIVMGITNNVMCIYIYTPSILFNMNRYIHTNTCRIMPLKPVCQYGCCSGLHGKTNIQLKTSPGFVVQQATYSFKCHDDVSVYHHFVWISPNSFLVLKRDVKTRLYRTRCRDWTHLGTIHSYILSYLHESMGNSGSSNGGTVPYKAIFGGAYPLT